MKRLLLVLLAPCAHAQVTDQPTRPFNEWSNVVVEFSLNDKTGCATGWGPPIDKYTEGGLQIALLDGARLSGAQQAQVSSGITAQSTALLTAARNVNVWTEDAFGIRQLDPMAKPCYDKRKPSPALWNVAPTSTGKRPAYLLNADGTRGTSAGYVTQTFTGNGKTFTNWCECWVRSKESTSSTYCKPGLGFVPNPGIPSHAPVVTLCREAK